MQSLWAWLMFPNHLDSLQFFVVWYQHWELKAGMSVLSGFAPKYASNGVDLVEMAWQVALFRQYVVDEVAFAQKSLEICPWDIIGRAISSSEQVHTLGHSIFWRCIITINSTCNDRACNEGTKLVFDELSTANCEQGFASAAYLALCWFWKGFRSLASFWLVSDRKDSFPPPSIIINGDKLSWSSSWLHILYNGSLIVLFTIWSTLSLEGNVDLRLPDLVGLPTSHQEEILCRAVCKISSPVTSFLLYIHLMPS